MTLYRFATTVSKLTGQPADLQSFRGAARVGRLILTIRQRLPEPERLNRSIHWCDRLRTLNPTTGTPRLRLPPLVLTKPCRFSAIEMPRLGNAVAPSASL